MLAIPQWRWRQRTSPTTERLHEGGKEGSSKLHQKRNEEGTDNNSSSSKINIYGHLKMFEAPIGANFKNNEGEEQHQACG